MKETRKCVICKDEFKAKIKSNRKTCSHECSLKFTAQARLKYNAKYQTLSYVIAKQKKKQDVLKAKMKIQNQKKETRKCIICYDDYTTTKTSTRKTCSHECALKYRAQYHQMPEVKRKAHIYNQKLDVKARVKKYNERYRQLPGMQVKLSKYQKEYHDRLDVKERRNILGKKSENIKHERLLLINAPEIRS